jgi:hypothetical protein
MTMLGTHWRFAPRRHRTVGADNAYDTADFVDQVREVDMTPHVAQNDTRRGGSAIDARTTRHAGYAMSQHARPHIERAFAWLKTIAGLRKVKLRGRTTVDAPLSSSPAQHSTSHGSSGCRRRPHENGRRRRLPRVGIERDDGTMISLSLHGWAAYAIGVARMIMRFSATS